jgi:zinc/manganese transport system permease protein
VDGTLQTLDLAILGPPLLAGLLVTLTHVPLGRQVLARGIIFIDLAIAQIAVLGVVAAEALGIAHGGWAVQGVAFGTALLGALALHWAEGRWPEVQEALIGTSFVVAASLAVLLLAANPHGAEHLRELLAGQVLWVTTGDLLPILLLYAAILAAWNLGAGRSRLGFYLLFALAVTASVQLVGVFLVFASLIIPALAVRQARAGAVLWGCGLSIAGYAVGLLGSALMDLPAGPAIVCALALLALPVAAWHGRREASDRT